MIVVICPGIHPPELTDGFVVALEQATLSQADVAEQSDAAQAMELWVLPPDIAPYAPDLIHQYLNGRWQMAELSADYPIAWIGFSAGVVGAVLTARRWQSQGGKVAGLIALDGWGVPLGAYFPRFRLGHDRFTAQSCEWLGASDGYFYCESAVEHLDLWRSPQESWGHWQANLNSPFNLDFAGSNLSPYNTGQSINAADLIAQLLSLLAQLIKFQS